MVSFSRCLRSLLMAFARITKLALGLSDMGVLTSQINQLCSTAIGSGANVFKHVA